MRVKSKCKLKIRFERGRKKYGEIEKKKKGKTRKHVQVNKARKLKGLNAKKTQVKSDSIKSECYGCEIRMNKKGLLYFFVFQKD